MQDPFHFRHHSRRSTIMSNTPADLAVGTSSWNYYPRTMIRLASIAYQDVGDIPASVEALGLNVVWGPVQNWDDDISDSLMYVAMRDQPNEYTVVIRGTNMDSWFSWTQEDFAVGTTQPFNQFAPHAPASALISQGTFEGMTLLLGLTDPNTGQTVTQFLAQANPQ